MVRKGWGSDGMGGTVVGASRRGVRVLTDTKRLLVIFPWTDEAKSVAELAERIHLHPFVIVGRDFFRPLSDLVVPPLEVQVGGLGG